MAPISISFLFQNDQLVLFSPVLLVILFGVYSLVTLIYRVATFNDCEAAAKELQEEIAEAKKELKAKGVDVN